MSLHGYYFFSHVNKSMKLHKISQFNNYYNTLDFWNDLKKVVIVLSSNYDPTISLEISSCDKFIKIY